MLSSVSRAILDPPRSRARLVSRATSASLGLLLALAGAASAEPHLSRMSGDVQVGRGEPVVWQAGREGAELGAGEAVRTGSDGRAEIDLGTAVVRLYENSLLRMPVDASRPDGPAAVQLDGGSSLFQVAPRPPQDPFEVRSPEVVASVKGTQFGVTLGAHGGAAVDVFSGQVGVRGTSGDAAREVMVYTGFAASGAGGRPFELSLVPAGDAWKGWSEGAPPLPLPAALGSPSASSHSLEEAKAAAQGVAAQEIARRVRPDSLAAHGGANLPAEIDKNGVAAVNPEPELTPIDKAAAIDSPTGRPIQEEVAGAILNGSVPGGTPAGAAGLGPLTVQVLDREGPDAVLISGAQGPLAQITEKQVETVIETGSAASLPASVVSALNANGVNPVTFAKQLSSMMQH